MSAGRAAHAKINKLGELTTNLIHTLQLSDNITDVNSTTILETVSLVEETLNDLKSLFDFREGSAEEHSDDSEEVWESDCEVLLEVVAQYTKSAISLLERSKLIEFETANSKLKEEVERLREECKFIDEIEKNRLTLMVGQLAFDIEERIIDHVLAGLLRSDQHIHTIVQLDMAIKRKPGFEDVFENEDDRKTAESNWTAFKVKFKWSNKHSRYIDNLKSVRLPIAHPKCDLKILQDALVKGNIAVRDKTLFKEFLEIFEQKW